MTTPLERAKEEAREAYFIRYGKLPKEKIIGEGFWFKKDEITGELHFLDGSYESYQRYASSSVIR